MKAPILYYCPQTRAETALWINEELGNPCTIEVIDIRAGAQKAPALLALNPMGKLPTLVHDEHVVTETAAICAYLADQYADQGLAPALDDLRRGTYYRWMFFAPSCLEPAMMDKLSGVERENTMSAGHGGFDDVVTAMESAIRSGPYILGEMFSAADIVLGSTINFATMFGALENTDPFSSYLKRLHERSAWKQASEKSVQIAASLGY